MINDMKELFGKIKCLFGYHDWEYTGFVCSDFTIKAQFWYKCKRCGTKDYEYK